MSQMISNKLTHLLHSDFPQKKNFEQEIQQNILYILTDGNKSKDILSFMLSRLLVIKIKW